MYRGTPTNTPLADTAAAPCTGVERAAVCMGRVHPARAPRAARRPHVVSALGLSRISLFSLSPVPACALPPVLRRMSLRRAARHRQRHLPWSGLGLLPSAAPIDIAPPIALAARRKPKQRKGTPGLNTGVSFCTDPPTWSRTSPSARIAKLSECLQSVVCGRCFRYAATFGWLRTASTDATRRSHLAAFSAAATDALSSKYSSTNT